MPPRPYTRCICRTRKLRLIRRERISRIGLRKRVTNTVDGIGLSSWQQTRAKAPCEDSQTPAIHSQPKVPRVLEEPSSISIAEQSVYDEIIA
jgi:hypothetical protein